MRSAGKTSRNRNFILVRRYQSAGRKERLPDWQPSLTVWALIALIIGRNGAGILDVLIEPRHLLPQHMFDSLLAAIAVRFVREENQTGHAAVAADGLVHA